MNMIKVPIIAEWDASKIIGTMEVDADALPPGDSFHFSIGYKVLEAEGFKVTKIQIVCVSPVADKT